MSKNSELLADFTKFCEEHPEHRFWQALRNWAWVNYVIVSKVLPSDAGFKDSWRDTFYWESREGR